MNVLKRAYLYDTRKKGKSLTLFLLFVLITLFLTISFYVLGAAQTAAADLRETVGASFSLHGKPMEFSKETAGYAMQLVPVLQKDIDLITDNSGIKAYNARQSASAAAGSFTFPSGMPSGTISANTSSAWNQNFTGRILMLAEGRHIVGNDQYAALISRELAEENGLQVGCELLFKDPAVMVEVVGIYESDAGMEFDTDTIFTDHDTFWTLTGSTAGSYSGRVDFFVTDPVGLKNIMEQDRQDVPLQWEDYMLSEDAAGYDAICVEPAAVRRREYQAGTG